jgi:signal recognition particle receptor subunit beta
MVVFNYSGEEINAKIVYYGPALSGKTTNLEFIHTKMPSNVKGKLVSMKTRTDRTLFFDFLPLELGEISGYRTRFNLYTVPGQVYYNATRKLVLKGADAVVFVADSTPSKMQENLESLRNLEENLNEHGMSLDSIPWVIQYNKRDLEGALPKKDLEKKLNPLEVPSFEAVATKGPGIYETFQGIAGLLYNHLKIRLDKEKAFGKNTPRPADTAGPPSGRPARKEAPDGGELDSVTDVVDVALREIDDGEVAAPGPKRTGAATDRAAAGSRPRARQAVGSPRDAAKKEPRDRDFIADAETNPEESQDTPDFSALPDEYPLEPIEDQDIDNNVGRVIHFDDDSKAASNDPITGEFITSPGRSMKAKETTPKKSRAEDATPRDKPVGEAPTERVRPEDAPKVTAPTVKPSPAATRAKPLPPKPVPPKEKPPEVKARRFPWQKAAPRKEVPPEEVPPREAPPKAALEESARPEPPRQEGKSMVPPDAARDASKAGAEDLESDLEEEYTVTIPIFISRSRIQGSIPIKIILDVREDD